jgi:NAD-dependent DNA ligase
MIFIYRNVKNETTIQHIENVSISEKYYQGISLPEKKLKTYRKDRILEMLSGHENALERLDHHLQNSPVNSEAISRLFNSTSKPEICFTGFKNEDKLRLINLAEEKGMFVRSSVTKNLDFLCCGYNAGPTKIESARQLGVIALTEHQFTELLITGEIPEQ